MNRFSFIQTRLNVRLPEDYKCFLDTTGYLCFENISQEVYGYKEGFDIEKLPCIIAATENCRGNYALKAGEIVLSHTGYQDTIVILDTQTSCVLELGLDGNRKKLADSFSSWIAAMSAKNKANTE